MSVNPVRSIAAVFLGGLLGLGASACASDHDDGHAAEADGHAGHGGHEAAGGAGGAVGGGGTGGLGGTGGDGAGGSAGGGGGTGGQGGTAGSGGAGGEGGGGGAIPIPAEVGSPCAASSECPAGGSGNPVCLTTFPGGYCSVDGCSAHASDCPGGAACVSAPTNRCMLLCQTAADCRDGYTCVSKQGGHSSSRVCFPE